MAQISEMFDEINGGTNSVDIAMSQIVVERVDNNWTEEIDEMDDIMSQIITEGDIAGSSAAGDMETDNNDAAAGSEIPQHLLEVYDKAVGEVLPKKSAKRYLNAYDVFVNWQEANQTSSLDEKVLLAYFYEAGRKYAPTTIWSMYSMLKSTLILKNNVDISRYAQLVGWIKRNSEGYEPKQSNVFTTEDIRRFILEAPNETYLAMKAVLGFGVVGLCRGDELTNLKCRNVRDTGIDIVVKIPYTKSKVPKSYVIDGELTNIIRQYMALRPPDATTDRFFLQYRKGRCINQVMGKNNIANVPKQMAKFLQLEDPGSYTGHSYRRTGTTVAADAGASFEQLMRMGPWKSRAVCEKYIQESLTHKRKLGRIITGALNLPLSSTAGASAVGEVASTSSAKVSGNATTIIDKGTSMGVASAVGKVASTSSAKVSGDAISPPIIRKGTSAVPDNVSTSNGVHSGIDVSSKMFGQIVLAGSGNVWTGKAAVSGETIPSTTTSAKATSANSESGSSFRANFEGLSQTITSIRNIEQYISETIHVPTSENVLNADTLISNGSGVSSQSARSANSVGINYPSNKGNVIYHFGGECSKFTIINMK